MLDFFRCFQQLGDPAEPLIVQQESKSIEADTPVTDVFVAIDARSEVLLRIVEVKKSDVPNADLPIELFDCALVRVAGAEVVTGCEDVASVEADSHAFRIIDQLDDFPELLERAAEA